MDSGPPLMDYDAELRLHNDLLRAAYVIQRQDQVLDIGCGTGQTTCDAARMAAEGSAVGVDLSAQMIDRARKLAEAERLRNVRFECANAETHRFPVERFDLAISRFGTMFFNDHVAAFANIGRALRPGGRLVMMVWQAHERNEWSVSIERALAGPAGGMPPVGEAPDPFSLAAPAIVRGILDAAGFADVTFTDVHRPVYYGRNVAAALDWVQGFSCTADVLSRSDPASAEGAVGRLRDMLAAHATESGVWFDSRAWIVKAHRRRPDVAKTKDRQP